jgi:hypothetical protein
VKGDKLEQVDAFDIGDSLSGDPGPSVHAGVAVAFTIPAGGNQTRAGPGVLGVSLTLILGIYGNRSGP